jgi:hypothetical protein
MCLGRNGQKMQISSVYIRRIFLVSRRDYGENSNSFFKRFLAVPLASFYKKKKKENFSVSPYSIIFILFFFLSSRVFFPPRLSEGGPALLRFAAVFLPYRDWLRVAASLHSMR